MASIIGGLATSHVPAIGGAIHKGRQAEPYWKPFFDAYPPVQRWLGEQRPDVVVVFYNDHGLNFFLDKMPTFAVGAAPRYCNADEGWGIPTTAPLAGCEDLSWHLVESLVADEFDIVTCQEMLVDHACTLPFRLFWPQDEAPPVQIVPIAINTVLFPLPTARRVYKLGLSVGRAITRWADPRRVLVMGTGGLSHQLEGERAGFINKRFDLAFLDSMERNPEWATQFSDRELVAQAGTQGVELLNWLAMRGALSAAGSSVTTVHRNYHIPISNTAAGLLALQVA
ncbi:MAG TPA: class III extradiol dioxygenase family protein [Rubrivivax sp.]|jgi:protocatechuate 4,5-dioxygenase beta chain|nr:class III extradiol dioxygenase family protein [Rubrivivax sp.]